MILFILRIRHAHIFVNWIFYLRQFEEMRINEGRLKLEDWRRICYYSNLSSGHLAELINTFHLCYIVDIR